MHLQEWDEVESRINAGGDLEKKIGDDVGLDLGLTTITLVAIYCLQFFFFFFCLYVTSYTQYIYIIRYPHNLHKVSQSSRKCLQQYKV